MVEEMPKNTTKKQGLIDSKSLVVQSNSLIEQPYKLTLREKKIVLLLASNINKDDEDFKPIRFKISEIAKFIGVDANTGTIYRQIKLMTKELRKKGFEVEYIDENNNKKRVLQIGWLSSAEYFVGEGEVELAFDPKLKPLLLFIKNNFTQYEIGNIAHLKSVYSIRMYELLKQYQSIGFREFRLDDLKTILKIDDKPAYNMFVKFRGLIETAKAELKEKCDLAFDYELMKEGRKFARIKFVFRKNEPLKERQASLFDNDTKPVNEELKAQLVALGFSEAVAVQLVQDYNEERILRNVKYGLERQSKGKIKSSFLGYIMDAIKGDWASKSPYLKQKEEEASKNKTDAKEKLEAIEKERRIIDSFYAEYSIYRNGETEKFIDANDRKSLESEFYEQANDYLKGSINKRGYSDKITAGLFYYFIRNQYKLKLLSFVEWIAKTKNVKVKQAGENEKDIEFIS